MFYTRTHAHTHVRYEWAYYKSSLMHCYNPLLFRHYRLGITTVSHFWPPPQAQPSLPVVQISSTAYHRYPPPPQFCEASLIFRPCTHCQNTRIHSFELFLAPQIWLKLWVDFGKKFPVNHGSELYFNQCLVSSVLAHARSTTTLELVFYCFVI